MTFFVFYFFHTKLIILWTVIELWFPLRIVAWEFKKI